MRRSPRALAPRFRALAKEGPPATGGRFLVVAPQGLGDSLEATPAVAALKAYRPSAKIDVVVLRPGPRELFEGLTELVDRVIEFALVR